MVDFKKLSEKIGKKRQPFGDDIPIRNEKLFMELHQQICPGTFSVDYDHGSFKDYVCSECSATFQKGTNIPMRYSGGYEEDMSEYFYGSLPEKLLEKYGLLKELKVQKQRNECIKSKKTKIWYNCKNW